MSPAGENRIVPPSNTTRPVSIRTVFLHVTKACNLRCSYCYFSASRPLPDEMTTDELTLLWPEIVSIAPEKVVFTGGEPLLRSDILDLLRGFREADTEHRVLCCLNSNGHLVTPQMARSLRETVDEVRVSLDGFQERNDALRGTGNFDAAMRALELYRYVGFEPKVLITVTSSILPDLDRFIRFLLERKIIRIKLIAFRPIGRGYGHHEWEVSPEALQGSITIPSGRRSDCDQMEYRSTCGVGQFVNIMPNGDVFPCHALTSPEFRCGNARRQPLTEICSRDGLIGSLARLDFRELTRQDQRLVVLNKSGTCMGTVHSRTKSYPIWRESLREQR